MKQKNRILTGDCNPIWTNVRVSPTELSTAYFCIYLLRLVLEQWFLGILAQDPLLKMTICPGSPRNYVMARMTKKREVAYSPGAWPKGEKESEPYNWFWMCLYSIVSHSSIKASLHWIAVSGGGENPSLKTAEKRDKGIKRGIIFKIKGEALQNHQGKCLESMHWSRVKLLLCCKGNGTHDPPVWSKMCLHYLIQQALISCLKGGMRGCLAFLHLGSVNGRVGDINFS